MLSVRVVVRAAVVAAVVSVALASAASAAVNIVTVLVGDPGNAGEVSGAGAGGSGPSRICGAVAYSYNIGKYEVTAGQYTAFLNSMAKTDTYGLYSTDMWSTSSGSGITRSGSSGTYAYSVASDFVNRPVNYLNWGDAARFANWLHNGQPTGAQGLLTTEDGAYYLNGATTDAQLLAVSRKAGAKWAITSEDEWYKAAYYKGGSTNAGYWDYPTSSNTGPGRDMADVSGNNANIDAGLPYLPYPIDSGRYTTVGGEFQNSDSPYGTFDQGGNVREWNEAIITDGGTYRGLRGGSYSSMDVYDTCAAARHSFSQTSEYSAFGFRVVEVPEPATMSLLALGGLALAARRRGRK